MARSNYGSPVTDAAGALDGVRVLDLTSVIMGPYATQLLGDLGADVIKVETGRGDTNRFMGGGPHPEMSGIALNINRNKRAVTLDVKHPDGLAAFLRILDTCDVFVTNLRPGPLGRLRLSYADLAPTRPRLVYCQAQGFRTGTADEDRPAYDDVIQAATGLARLSNATVGATTFLPALIGDKVAGQTIVSAILAALLHRERTGRGQRVEVPMFDAVLAFNLVEHLSRAAIEGEPSGYSRILTTTRGPHRTRRRLRRPAPVHGRALATAVRSGRSRAAARRAVVRRHRRSIGQRGGRLREPRRDRRGAHDGRMARDLRAGGHPRERSAGHRRDPQPTRT